MENGKRRKRGQLTPREKWEIFLEVTSQELSQADAARKWGVDVSVIIRLRALAKDAALAAFAASKPGRLPSPEQVELEAALAENDRLSEALKELAVELSLHRGRQRSASPDCRDNPAMGSPTPREPTAPRGALWRPTTDTGRRPPMVAAETARPAHPVPGTAPRHGPWSSHRSPTAPPGGRPCACSLR